ncbi:FtsX-like permease family protein [Larkinella terrae]|uniref:FtsX-like permease family protein n=2 Tax=Larkinella terrae TaxID=2025311 RepID=A0A7K0EI44_9BACT|nr:FtsX-like permease family protein [Larkinella terrae]
MIQNYLKIAWRNVRNQPALSFLNVFGLALGLASCLLITLYVVDELSYDRFHKKADRIYRVDIDAVFGGTEQRLTQVGDPIGPTLQKDYPQVEAYVRFYNVNASKLVRNGQEIIDERRSVHADPTLFDVFTFPALYGNTKTALDAPNSVVITESTARRYFGTPDAVGKPLEVNRSLYTITAVIRDMPQNSHFHFDFIFPMKAVTYDWGNFLTSNFQTYVVLKEGVHYQEFNRNFAQVIERYFFPQAQQHMKMSSAEDFNRGGNKLVFALFPLTDIHLRSDRQDELEANGNIQFVYIFSAIALFVLLIACVNFMNLSTARSAKRAREVGIRKTMGTNRPALIGQFLTESTLTVFFSLLLALGITAAGMPFFNELAAKSLSVNQLFMFPVLPVLLLIPLVVGLLAGSYPAFFLSGFKPVAVLKGSIGSGFRKSNFRNALVVFQFATSVMLIIGTLIIYRQLNYIQTRDIGFNKQQVLIVNGTHALGSNIEPFKNELLTLPNVVAGTLSGFLPVSSSARNGLTLSKVPVSSPDNMFDTQNWFVDYDYLKTMGMTLTQGRNFSKDFGSDASAVVINESLAKLLGYQNPVGQKIYPVSNGTATPFTIIGVVKDFNYESLRQTVSPLLFSLRSNTELASFRVNTQDLPKLLQQVEAVWKKFPTGAQFSYRFMDEAFDTMYRAEQRVGQIALTFAGLAILIACLGLFGLATYMAEQRTKEIGIRKVLGASAGGIVTLLSRDFLKLVLIAILVASPVAWYVMNRWLQEFAYKINMEWWVFAVAGLLAIGIALLTVSFQSIKAALMNPVKSLRSE